jgi:hypothetical protein
MKNNKKCRKKTETNAGQKNWKNAEKQWHIPYHPNKYTDSELFLENLTQYTIHTLIGV